MNKATFIETAKNYGVNAKYSGQNKAMFITGEDTKVKSFIRICNLKGKGAYYFAVAQGK